MFVNSSSGLHALCQPVQLAWRFVTSTAKYPRMAIAKELWKSGDTFKGRVTNVRGFWQVTRHPALKLARECFQALQIGWAAVASVPSALCKSVEKLWQNTHQWLRGMNIPLA